MNEKKKKRPKTYFNSLKKFLTLRLIKKKRHWPWKSQTPQKMTHSNGKPLYICSLKVGVPGCLLLEENENTNDLLKRSFIPESIIN